MEVLQILLNSLLRGTSSREQNSLSLEVDLELFQWYREGLQRKKKQISADTQNFSWLTSIDSVEKSHKLSPAGRVGEMDVHFEGQNGNLIGKANV